MDIIRSRALFSELSRGYEPGSIHWVNILHVNNPHSFYVRPSIFEPLVQCLEVQVPETKELNVIRDLVMFDLNPSSERKRFARGRIFSIQKHNGNVTCDVVALDYGFVQKYIPLKSLFKCNENMSKIPPLAVHCRLANCIPTHDGEWPEEAIQALTYFLGYETAKMTVVSKISDKLDVKMENTCPDDMATLLDIKGFSTLTNFREMLCRLPSFVADKKYFNFKSVLLNDNLRVHMQYGSSLKAFYVTRVRDYKTYHTECNNILNLVKTEESETSNEDVENMPVYVTNEVKNYEKGLIKSPPNINTDATIPLIDSGKKLIAHILNEEQVQESCLRTMAIATYCTVEEPQLSDSRLQRVLLTGYEFIITIKKVGHKLDTPNTVTITTIGKY